MDVECDFPCFYSGVVERDNTRGRVKIVNARRGDTRREKKSFRMAIFRFAGVFFLLCERFEPRNTFISRLSIIVRVYVVLSTTVVDRSD